MNILADLISKPIIAITSSLSATTGSIIAQQANPMHPLTAIGTIVCIVCSVITVICTVYRTIKK